ncbi:transducin beta-like protein 2 [Pelomyxa schiedti]|nr:transducin beta-like protein 2 [Pelomyxa schiedti]
MNVLLIGGACLCVLLAVPLLYLAFFRTKRSRSPNSSKPKPKSAASSSSSASASSKHPKSTDAEPAKKTSAAAAAKKKQDHHKASSSSHAKAAPAMWTALGLQAAVPCSDYVSCMASSVGAKFLAFACADGTATVVLSENPKSGTSIGLGNDTVSNIAISANGFYLAIYKAFTKELEIYTKEASAFNKTASSPSGHSSLRTLHFLSNSVVVTCDETCVKLWSTSLDVLHKWNPCQLSNNSVCSCSKFLCVLAEMPDTRIWGIQSSPTGEFHKIEKALLALGHTRGVLCGNFSLDGKLFATASKDGTLRLWNVNVPYTAPSSESAKEITRISIADLPPPISLSFSPSNDAIAVLFGPSIHVYSVPYLKEVTYFNGYPIPQTHMTWSSPTTITSTCTTSKSLLFWTTKD